MKQSSTILDVLELDKVSENSVEILELIEGEYIRCRDSGDFLGAGEWLLSRLKYDNNSAAEEIYSKIISIWASPLEMQSLPSNIDEIITMIDQFTPDELCVAFISASASYMAIKGNLPEGANSLAYRLRGQLAQIYSVDLHLKPLDICMQSVSNYQHDKATLLLNIESFSKTNCTTAKSVSIDIVKSIRNLKKKLVTSEKPILTELEFLLGTSFRSFCESCERSNTADIYRKAPDIRAQTEIYLKASSSRENSVLWHVTVIRIAKHILQLADEASQRSESITIPELSLATKLFKIDLKRTNYEMYVSATLANSGKGRAQQIEFQSLKKDTHVSVKVTSPKGHFQISGESLQLVTFKFMTDLTQASLSIPIVWRCVTDLGKTMTFEDNIEIHQQSTSTNWDLLKTAPPYSLRPIKTIERLFGRDAQLNRLKLNAHAGTSTMVWGQKRVGKTSVLQVLESELTKGSVICIMLRMGELKGLHEGQIAHRIAERLSTRLSRQRDKIPDESAFGAGLSRLVPFMDDLIREFPQDKFVVIIDEFDDFSPTYYMGERGKQFIKALRSLSEIGLTFFFVGSERMSKIYDMHHTHSQELNTWVNIALDRIESRKDCIDLIVKPVDNQIEYQAECVDFIVDYCNGNPYYMTLFCSQVMEKCIGEGRSFVGISDLESVRQILIEQLGETNFAHFWADNPEIDELKMAAHTAENCLVLSCMSFNNIELHSLNDMLEAQGTLISDSSLHLSERRIKAILDRLRRRNIVVLQGDVNGYSVPLPIFRDWLKINAELKILPKWTEYQRIERMRENKEDIQISVTDNTSQFPIPEEELLSVSQNLIYCGKQKDVSEIRVFLRQFDDEVRIEIAFRLLKRLSEKGFIAEGAKLHNLTVLQEAVHRKRSSIGSGAWTSVLRKLDNLCITHVDSDTKSGAAIARELAKRIRPGKIGSPSDISEWLSTHFQKDPILLVVDDFAGTGRTLKLGLNKLLTNSKTESIVEKYLKAGRVLCYLLYSFPEAIESLKTEYPQINFFSVETLTDELRALDSDADIFEDSNDIKYATEILLQYGRQLTPQNPLGWGNLGALIAFHNTVPNNTLPIFWSSGIVNGKQWKPLFPRA